MNIISLSWQRLELWFAAAELNDWFFGLGQAKPSQVNQMWSSLDFFMITLNDAQATGSSDNISCDL